MDVRLLNSKWVEMVSVEDRKRLGIATAEELMKKAWAKTERQLQNQIVQYLGLRGIEVVRSRMDRKTTGVKGTPDLIFSVRGPCGIPRPCAFEVKMDNGVVSRAQNDMLQRMKASPNCWDVRVVRSLIEVVDLMREWGL
jgi:hypothetical protein